MTRSVYISFLGLGSFDKNTGTYAYNDTVYELEGKMATSTPFVQVAEMELLDGRLFDKVFIAATDKSREVHFEELKSAMAVYKITPEVLTLKEDFTSKGQWEWFENILSVIEANDRIVVDLTHGYRAVPIIFSAAINFLQKARNIELQAVYYGAYDSNKKCAPIVDIKEFYLINEWADSVSRLVEDADARKLGETAQKASSFQLSELNDPDVTRVFMELTDAIRNVEVNHVGEKTKAALALIAAKSEKASSTGKMLLGLVTDKFIGLATEGPVTQQYDRDYFRVQIEIARLLLEHRLFMQAYTVMREFIPSIAMIYYEKRGINNKKRKKYRQFKAEVFLQMVQRPKEEWEFENEDKKKASEDLMPYYRELSKVDIISEAKKFLKDLTRYRNGFDHAWTAMPKAKDDIPERGKAFLTQLEKVHLLLIQHVFPSK